MIDGEDWQQWTIILSPNVCQTADRRFRRPETAASWQSSTR